MPSREPPDNQRAALWRRTATLASVGLFSGLLGACISVSTPSPAATGTATATPTTAQLVDQLPAPADVASCDAMTATARAFIHATATAALAERSAEASGSLLERLRVLGDGYADRTMELGCSEAQFVEHVRNLPRPDEGASTTEIVEYVVSGGDLTYPLHDQPMVLTNGDDP